MLCTHSVCIALCWFTAAVYAHPITLSCICSSHCSFLIVPCVVAVLMYDVLFGRLKMRQIALDFFLLLYFYSMFNILCFNIDCVMHV